MSKEEKRSKKRRNGLILLAVTLILIIFSIYAMNQLIEVTWDTTNELIITLHHPSDHAAITENITYFNWTGSGGVAPLTYVWYCDTDPTFTSPNLRTADMSTDSNYTTADGLQPFLDGEWYWRVEVTDSVSTQNNSLTYNFTILTNVSNSFPSLSAPLLSPTAGSSEYTYYYYITFTDVDNTTPSNISVFIDDIPHTMTELTVSDTNISDGKRYYYSTTLNNGTHNYSFYCEDQNATNATPLYTGPTVTNITITNISPTNQSYNNILTPTCSVDINSATGRTMNISFAHNATGAWTIYQTNHTVTNGTYTLDYTDANTHSSKYYWRIYVDDQNINKTRIYHFTIENITIPGEDDDDDDDEIQTHIRAPPYLNITGPDEALINIEYNYTAFCKHSVGNIYYKIEWGDGNTTNWTGPYRPYRPINFPYTYTTLGIKNQTLHAKVLYSVYSNTANHTTDVVTQKKGEIDYNYLIYFLILLTILYILYRTYIQEPRPTPKDVYLKSKGKQQPGKLNKQRTPYQLNTTNNKKTDIVLTNNKKVRKNFNGKKKDKGSRPKESPKKAKASADSKKEKK